MDLKGFDFALDVEHVRAREKLINELKTSPTIQKFMARYECPFEVIEVHSFKFKSWLEELNRVSKLTRQDLENDLGLGRYIDLYYDKEKELLLDEVRHVPMVDDILRASEYLNQYQIFPLNKTLLNATFESIELEKENGKYIKAMEKLISFLDDDALGYYLYGDLGVGKSYLAACVSNAYAKQNKSVGFVSNADLLSHIKSNFARAYEQDFTLEILKNVDLLVLDDLGAEPITTWARDEVLLPLLNARLENHKKTLFTSNYAPKHLEALYATDHRGNQDLLRSKRFVDRIFAISYPLEIVGVNRRHNVDISRL